MRSFIFHAAAVCAMLLAGNNSYGSVSVPEPNLSDFKALNGIWQAVYLEMSGEPLPSDELSEFVFEFRDGTLAIQDETDRVRYALNENAGPKHFDVVEADGISRGIYWLAGDELTLCVAVKHDGERPTQFLTTADNESVLIVLRRVK